ncbi:MAG TPA: hypothetical protein VFW65_38800 [Pseudonocardiaceae bacterium]|jgi:hypothetical protein|nr:hypothetical protein [Pseudonocardiaceae bacterium]
MTVRTFCGITVDSGVYLNDECTMKHAVYPGGIEVDLGHATASLHLGMTDKALKKLAGVLNAAVAELEQDDAVQQQARPDESS